MLKKELIKEIDELEERIGELTEERGELRYKVSDYDKLEEKAERLTKELSKLEGRLDLRVELLTERIRELTLRNDILTMTPEQIEAMRKVKAGGRMNDPLDLVNRNRDRVRERIGKGY